MVREIVRKSPIVIVRNFIALEFFTAAVYWIAGAVFYVAQIWRGLPLVSSIPFSAAQAGFVFLLETTLILYMFLMWYRETFRITGGKLIHDQGVIIRSHEVIALDRVVSASYRQGFLGRRTGYGTVTLTDRSGVVLMKVGSIADPQEFVSRLTGYRAHQGDVDPLRMVTEAEHERLERKSTLRWDLQAGKLNRNLEKAVMKTVAAFLNSSGGHLLLGVADDGHAVGLERDWTTLARRDADGWENHFTNVLSAMIGPQFRQYVTIQHFAHQDKSCALVIVAKAPVPAYLNDEGKEEFFIRTGNTTTSLPISRAQEYLASHFS